MDLVTLRDRFFAFEIEDRLFKLEFRGVRFWDYIRYFVFTDLATRLGFVPERPAVGQMQRRRRLRSLSRELLHVPGLAGQRAVQRLARPRACDVVFFDCEVKRLIDGKLVDYRGFPFVRNIAPAIRVLAVDPSRLTESMVPSYPCDAVSSRMTHYWSTARARAARLTPAEESRLRDLTARCQAALGEVDLRAVFRQAFLPQFFARDWIRSLFLRHRPALVGYLNDTMKKGVIDVAHQLGIPVFELQHGVTSPFDLITSYPAEATAELVGTIPEYVLTFGEYWNTKFNHPAEKIPVGFPFLEQQRARLLSKAAETRPNALMGVSVNEQTVANTLIALARRLPHLKFLYKLRPSEYACWREIYDPALGQLPNLTVIDNDDVTLFEYFLKTTYLVTINSTAIYEGLAFGVVPIVHKGPYYEDVLDLVSAGQALLADGPDEVRAILEAGRVPAHVTPYQFFADHSESRMRSTMRALVATARARQAAITPCAS